MVDLLITGGTVVTMNAGRDVIEDGAVAVEGGTVVGVGPSDEVAAAHDADRTVDATDHAVVPGFINCHTHIADILVRGGGITDRALYDWLFNIIKPVRAEMNADEHAVASALYSQEAIQSGITTFVENAIGGGSGYPDEIVEAKLDVYDDAGMRNVYCQSFIDEEMAPKLAEFVRLHQEAEPEINHPGSPMVDTDEALRNIEDLIRTHHGQADGRQSVWPGPLSPRSTTTEGLQACYDLAEEYDVMTTTHVSETTHEEMAIGGGHFSMTEYLHEIGYLGPRALLGHCVHLSERDIRLLRDTDTRVAHNVISNLQLGSGVAPIPQMLNYGVIVGMGTDNTSCSDTVNMVNDIRYAALLQKGVQMDSTVMTPEKALEMATIDAARAIGRADDLGSLEPGKRADLLLLDLDYTHFQPRRNVASAIVYQAQGFEVDTVVCEGEVIMEDRIVGGIEDRYPDLFEQAAEASAAVIERTGLRKILLERPWKSVGPRIV